MPKIMLNCRSNGRRQIGRPLKRLLDEAKRALSRPNSWQMMMMTTGISWQHFHHFMKVQCSFSSAHILCWHNATKCPHITFILTWCNQLPTHRLHNCSSIYSALLVRCNLEFHKLSYKSLSKISTKYYRHDCDWETIFKIPFLHRSYCSMKLVNQMSIACLCAIHYTPPNPFSHPPQPPLYLSNVHFMLQHYGFLKYCHSLLKHMYNSTVIYFSRCPMSKFLFVNNSSYSLTSVWPYLSLSGSNGSDGYKDTVFWWHKNWLIGVSDKHTAPILRAEDRVTHSILLFIPSNMKFVCTYNYDHGYK